MQVLSLLLIQLHDRLIANTQKNVNVFFVFFMTGQLIIIKRLFTGCTPGKAASNEDTCVLIKSL